MKKLFAYLLILLAWAQYEASAQVRTESRQAWLHWMDSLARPVLSNIAENKLKERMPVVFSPKVANPEGRPPVAYLEAFGRTLSGIAPWLNLEGGSQDEQQLRAQYRQWALKGLANAVDPKAKDYLTWKGGQPLVDASFVALALIRCPWLWQHSSSKTKTQIVEVFKLTRNTVPVYSNWLLFSGMIEAFFCANDLDYDKVRVEYAVREFANHWYTGDGMYSDGMNFAMDYYNSIVIHPFLATILQVVNAKDKTYNWYAPRFEKITSRYAEVLERMIARDGTYPVLGRSICYRAGVFHHLAAMSLRKALPETLKPAQLRGALSAVIQRTFEAPTTFNAGGWLNLGLYGTQPGLADSYINTGSLYLCATIFLPLGLPDTDEFWTGAAVPWTSLKIWSGMDAPGDHALH